MAAKSAKSQTAPLRSMKNEDDRMSTVSVIACAAVLVVCFLFGVVWLACTDLGHKALEAIKKRLAKND